MDTERAFEKSDFGAVFRLSAVNTPLTIALLRRHGLPIGLGKLGRGE